jgi:lysyl-tRNA synthetase class 2
LILNSGLQIRQQLLKITRQYFWANGFIEIDPPILLPSLPIEPNIYSFSTIWQNNKKNLYLATSPESTLKQVLTSQKQNCFTISKSFRDLEASSSLHQPEFTMLEWYEIGHSYTDLMTSTQNYITHCFNKININRTLKLPNTPWPQIPLAKLFADQGFSLPQNEPDLNQLFLNHIEPKLPKTPIFIIDYPTFMSPLAKPKNNLAERFELYINGIEIANGCSENTDAKLIENNFATEVKFRLQNNLPTHPTNPDFAINSANLPTPIGGVGLGFDRLTMLLSGATTINDVVYTAL